MPGYSRPKGGVLSHAYVPGIHDLLSLSKTWMAGTSPAMTLFTHSPSTAIIVLRAAAWRFGISGW